MAWDEANRADGLHKHECQGCGHVWEHEDDLGEPDRCSVQVFDEAHNCPQCGMRRTFKYHGTKPAERRLALVQQAPAIESRRTLLERELKWFCEWRRR